MNAPTLSAQCAFIDREIKLRKVVYAAAIKKGEMTFEHAQDRMAHLLAVQKTVQQVLRDEATAEWERRRE
jgi:hypothetical protein